MCRHRQQFRHEEQSQAINLIFNNKTKSGCGSGWTSNEYRHSSKPQTVGCNADRQSKILKSSFNKRLEFKGYNDF